MRRTKASHPDRETWDDVPNCQTGPGGRLRFVLREARLAWADIGAADMVPPNKDTKTEPEHPSEHDRRTPRGLS